ncbi:hypothetical protein CYMTET_18543 [Cymbomonas tetramitiformis]|uniref:HAT C-terminal dimerisation domain-containing protein n=1 Tax=Cymbomonas tetramitiformis TaxID=36881 RepID=A0AAE0G834_9CHLO|nr:hypothetical protein CYMTET_18543 [Cymbomonas tetramitiformis]
MVGFSNVRWWSRQEVENGICENFGDLHAFLQELESDGVGDATTRKMQALHQVDPLLLQVSFAAGYDGTLSMLKTTYEMEGDRLEILLVYRRVEALRAFGRSLREDDANRGTLPNVDAVIRRAMTPAVGLAIKKDFPEHGVFTGHIKSIDKDDPADFVYLIEYEDGDQKTMVLAEMQPLLSVHGSSLREYALFDPSFVAENADAIDSVWVQRLVSVVPIARADRGKLVPALEGELAAYIAKAKGFTCDHTDVATFTEAVLSWWRNHAKELPQWAKAARIVFSLSPNSCACERVLSLLKNMFGEDQSSCLADYLQGTLMLRYNKRL